MQRKKILLWWVQFRSYGQNLKSLVKICSSYVSGQFKKCTFEKNAFKVLSIMKAYREGLRQNLKLWYLKILPAHKVVVYYF